ncbi:MAG: GNAT family N-acetyltransferase [Phycisphaerales bacterium]|nr:MAG: GNAT family N-acetyltransferase [Phycisphaerales bacterium]
MRIVHPSTDELWAAYLACRFRSLYAPYDLPETCTTSELDHPRDRPGVVHRAALDDAGAVIGVGRIDEQPGSAYGHAAQLRYFAVDAAARAGGVGRTLLGRLEDDARAWGCVYLWMEARDEALGFYARAGYETLGPGPTKWDLIPHHVMGKPLTPNADAASA